MGNVQEAQFEEIQSGQDFFAALDHSGGSTPKALASIRSGQGSDRCDSHQILHGLGEVPVQRDEGVCVKLGQGDVFGVKCVIPPKLVGDLPCDVLEDAVSQQPDP